MIFIKKKKFFCSSKFTLNYFRLERQKTESIFLAKFLEWQLCHSSVLVLCSSGQFTWVLSVIVYKYASCIIPYIDSFFFLCGDWSSLALKDFLKYFFKPNVLFFSICCERLCINASEKRKRKNIHCIF